MATSNADSTTALKVNIKGPSEIKLTISIESDATVRQLKEEIAKEKPDVPVDCQRLIYAGKVLKDDQPLSDYKLQNNHTVHLVKSASRSAPSTGNPTTTTTTASSSSSSTSTIPPSASAGTQAGGATTGGGGVNASPASAAQGVPSNFGAGQQFANNPLAALNRADLAGPHMANIGRNLFQGSGMNPSDPNMLMNALGSEDFQAHMRSMLRRPEVIDQIIAMNPQMAAMGPQMRQMMQSDSFIDMMTNPETMRRMMQLQNAMGGQGGGAGGGDGGLAGLFGGGAGAQQQQQWPPPGAFGTPAGNGQTQGADQQGRAAAAAADNNPFAALAGLGGLGGLGGGAGGANAEQEILNNPFLRNLLGAEGGVGGGGGADFTGGIPFGAFGNLGNFGNPATTNATNAGGSQASSTSTPTTNLPPPEERYASQLQSLRDMGFVDGPANLRALLISGGSVEGAISVLLGGN